MSESKPVSLVNKDKTMVIRVPRDGAADLVRGGDWNYTTKSVWRRYKKGKPLVKDSRTVNEVFSIEE